MKTSESLSLINPQAAGVDVGSQKMFVSIAGGPPKIFGCCTRDLEQLRDHLLGHGVRTVAMEATGVYWLCLYGVLEAAGVTVLVVNGAHVKNVPGRKTDMLDCQWLSTLHAHGLLRSGFVPPAQIRQLRDYQRVRSDLVRMSTEHVQHMHKALERLNLKFHTVISSILGASGWRLIRAILHGERNPVALVALCDEQILKRNKESLLKALEGNWQEEHLFALRLAVEAWDFYQSQIRACDTELARLIRELAGSDPEPSLGPRKELRNNAPKNQPQLQSQLGQIYGTDLTRIPGLNSYSVTLLLSEVGTEMSRWPTVKHFTSWLGLTPGQNQSGKRKGHKKRYTGKAGRIFCLLAQSMAFAKKTKFGAIYRRIRARRGGPTAVKATARRLAEMFYLALTRGWDYVEEGLEKYEAQFRARQEQQLERLAKELGLRIMRDVPA